MQDEGPPAGPKPSFQGVSRDGQPPPARCGLTRPPSRGFPRGHCAHELSLGDPEKQTRRLVLSSTGNIPDVVSIPHTRPGPLRDQEPQQKQNKEAGGGTCGRKKGSHGRSWPFPKLGARGQQPGNKGRTGERRPRGSGGGAEGEQDGEQGCGGRTQGCRGAGEGRTAGKRPEILREGPARGLPRQEGRGCPRARLRALQLGSRPSGSGTEASGPRAGECPQNTNKPLFILETRRKLGREERQTPCGEGSKGSL